jgi:hypothetical protein
VVDEQVVSVKLGQIEQYYSELKTKQNKTRDTVSPRVPLEYNGATCRRTNVRKRDSGVCRSRSTHCLTGVRIQRDDIQRRNLST